jgi:hypothetical protein
MLAAGARLACAWPELAMAIGFSSVAAGWVAAAELTARARQTVSWALALLASKPRDRARLFVHMLLMVTGPP